MNRLKDATRHTWLLVQERHKKSTNFEIYPGKGRGIGSRGRDVVREELYAVSEEVYLVYEDVDAMLDEILMGRT